MCAPNDLSPYASGADVGIIPFPVSATLSISLTLPNKFYEMVMARLPIVKTDLPNIKLLVNRFGNGLVVDEKNFGQVVSEIRDLIKRRRQPDYFESIPVPAAAALC
jgi:hypothetical protein